MRSLNSGTEQRCIKDENTGRYYKKYAEQNPYS